MRSREDLRRWRKPSVIGDDGDSLLAIVHRTRAGARRADRRGMTIHRRLHLACSLVFSSAVGLAVTTAGCTNDVDEQGEPASASTGPTEVDPHAHDEATADFAAPDDSAALGADDLDLTPALEEDVAAPDIAPGDVGSVAQAASRVGSPVPGRRVTYPYGVRSSRYKAGFHTGQDYAAPTGTRVVAVRSGRIRWSNNNGGAYGRWIGLDADNGRTYVYCHLSSRAVAAGTRVHAGQTLGKVGATGNVTGPHLHFEDHPKGPFRYAQVRKPAW